MVAAPRDDLLSSQVRRRIVDFIRDSPAHLAAADLGRLLGLHVTTVRFHLDQLEQAGVILAERERRDRVGRPRKVYTVAPQTVPVNESAYVVLADVLIAAMPGDARDREQAAVRAGQAWARKHATEMAVAAGETDPASLPVRELVDVLAQWGYPRETVTVEQPQPDCHRMTLLLCPMREAAAAHPEVVCATHLGIIRGTLERLGVHDADVTVHPMVTPVMCTVDLALPGSGVNVLDLAAISTTSAVPAVLGAPAVPKALALPQGLALR